MPPKQSNKPKATNVYHPRIKGKGTFNDGGRKWSSHHASVRFKVKLDANGDPVGDVTPVRHFGQLPRSGGSGQYVHPFFRRGEWKRMKARAIKAAVEAFTSNRLEVPRPPQLRKDEPLHEGDLCELCEELGFPCTGVLVDVEGNVAQFPAQVLKERLSRLLKGGLTELFHQTSAQSAAAILRSQRMYRGSRGSLGGGIYFADSAKATDRKVRRKDPNNVILKATVQLGKPKEVLKWSHQEKSNNFHSLLEAGYDSVVCPVFKSGTEYVVFNHDQVTNITVHQ